MYSPNLRHILASFGFVWFARQSWRLLSPSLAQSSEFSLYSGQALEQGCLSH
jgi:hypothetical protein